VSPDVFGAEISGDDPGGAEGELGVIDLDDADLAFGCADHGARGGILERSALAIDTEFVADSEALGSAIEKDT
jgi:hypothetical protein